MIRTRSPGLYDGEVSANVPNPGALISAVRRGEEGARARLIDAWLPVVLTWCNRLCGPKVDPEDAAHDVLLKVLGRIDSIREPDRFAGWLFAVTRSTVRQHRRRAWIQRWVPGVVPERTDPSRDPLANAERRETARRVQLALEELSDNQREAIVLCDLEGRTAAEAAELIGAAVGTVKSRLRLGRERFRKAALDVGLGPVVRDAHDRGEL